MELNIRNLLRTPDLSLESSEEFDLSKYDFSGYTISQPVELSVRAVADTGAVTLFIQIKAKVSTFCARCLIPIESKQCIQKEYRVTRLDLAEEFPELPILPNGSLELEKLAYEELVMEVPGVLLCKQDCAGLCAECGKPAQQCSCEEAPEGDPRLQILKQLLSDS